MSIASSGLTRGAAAGALVALVVVAVWLRLHGIDYLLPHSTHLDATVIENQVELLRHGGRAADTAQLDEWYPYLLARLVAMFPDPLCHAAGALDLAGHLRRAALPFLEIRIVSALASVPIVVATYLLSRKFLSRGWSLCAAAWLATSLLNISFAQQERPHGLAASLTVFTVLAAMHLWRAPTLASCTLVGVLAGFTIGALQNGVAVGFPIVAAVVIALSKPRGERPPWTRVAIGAVLALAVIGVCLRVFYPFHFEGQRGFLELDDAKDGTTFNLSGQTVYLEHFNGEGFPTVFETLYSYDPVLLVVGALALVVWCVVRARGERSNDRERRRDFIVALAYTVPYFLVIGLHALTWERYVMPLQPFLACAGAWGLQRVLGARVKLAIAVVVLAQLVPAFFAWRIGHVRDQPDTYARTAEWIAAHATPERDRIVAMPYLELPLFHDDDVLASPRHFSYWQGYEASVPAEQRIGPRFELVLPKGQDETFAEYGDDPLAHLRELGARYVIVQHVGEKFRIKLITKLRKQLQANATLAARFSPLEVDDGGNANLEIRYVKSTLARPFTRALVESRCMGPTIEVYELADATR